ncbi:hypothetical protein [Bacillus toyonensis]|uniref:Uncharacterized protein n=1 Tax=Bacillus toyonensis TaxID=155322 RepID=A0AB73REG6_9BACI|nr:hypothetical protein [Bacillus toyonensis]PEI85887.1 hypothetical protein CN678_14340 [Bacillus toyonensis]
MHKELRDLEERIKEVDSGIFLFSLYALLPYIYDYFVLNFNIPQFLTGDAGRIFLLAYEVLVVVFLFYMVFLSFKLNKKRRKLIG